MKSYKLEDQGIGYMEEHTDKPFPIPEPPIWLGACLAALIGAVFIGAIIALHYLTH